MSEIYSKDDVTNSIEKLVNSKEEEIKQIFYSKINKLQNELKQKENHVKDIEEKFERLKKDYAYNYNLIEERDSDLKIYEEKIDSFNLILEEKEERIKYLISQIDELNKKLTSEKTKKENNEELMRFNNAKLTNQLKEERNNNSIKLEEMKKTISILSEENKSKLEDVKLNFESEKRKLGDNIESLNLKLKDFLEKDGVNKKEIEEYKSLYNRVSNENLNLIKEKIHLENKLKLYENDESEFKTNNSILNEKAKFLQKEMEEMKLTISAKNTKIESLNKLIEENTTEINSLKQKIQLKDFELERKVLGEKIISEKLKDSDYQVEKLIDEKRNLLKEKEEIESKLRSCENKLRHVEEETMELKFSNKKLKEENEKLKEEAKQYNQANFENNLNNFNSNKIKILPQQNEIFNSKDEDTSHMLEFFKDRNNLNPRESVNLKNLIKEKEAECERLSKELEGAKIILMKVESEMTQTFNLYKESENKLQEKINKLELDLIRKDLEIKNELKEVKTSKSFKEEKEKQNIIQNNKDLEDTISKYKVEVKRQTEIIEKLKDSLREKVNECKRIKYEREKMAETCIKLRAQINNLENKNEEGIRSERINKTNDYEKTNNHYNQIQLNSDYNSEIENFSGRNVADTNIRRYDRTNKSLTSTISREEFEEYRRKRNLLLGDYRDEDQLRSEAKSHIENIMNKTYRDDFPKRRSRSPRSPSFRESRQHGSDENGDRINSLPKTRTFRSRSKSKPSSKSNSRSNSKSKRKFSPDYLNQAINIKSIKSDDDYLSLPKLNKIHHDSNYNPASLKLLKRTRNKSGNKEETAFSNI